MLAPLTSLVVKYSGEILIPPLLFLDAADCHSSGTNAVLDYAHDP